MTKKLFSVFAVALILAAQLPKPGGSTGGGGGGSGDMLGANNLSELTNAVTARSNLGLVIGTNVEAFSATPDWSARTSTKPIKTGTSAPATCGVGEFFYDTNADAGINLFGCTSTNTWTLLGDGGANPIAGSYTSVSGSTVNATAAMPIVVSVTTDDDYAGSPTGCSAVLSGNKIIMLVPDVDNTGPATLAYCGGAALAIKLADGTTDPADGDLAAGRHYSLRWVDAATDYWRIESPVLVNASVAPRHAAAVLRRDTLHIPFGDRVLGAALLDTQDYLRALRNIQGTFRVIEIGGYADAGTPTINVQRDDGSAADLLSAALSLSTTYACARVSGDATSGDGSTTCSETLSATERDFSVGHELDALIVAAGGTAKEIILHILIEWQ